MRRSVRMEVWTRRGQQEAHVKVCGIVARWIPSWILRERDHQLRTSMLTYRLPARSPTSICMSGFSYHSREIGKTRFWSTWRARATCRSKQKSTSLDGSDISPWMTTKSSRHGGFEEVKQRRHAWRAAFSADAQAFGSTRCGLAKAVSRCNGLVCGSSSNGMVTCGTTECVFCLLVLIIRLTTGKVLHYLAKFRRWRMSLK